MITIHIGPKAGSLSEAEPTTAPDPTVNGLQDINHDVMHACITAEMWSPSECGAHMSLDRRDIDASSLRDRGVGIRGCVKAMNTIISRSVVPEISSGWCPLSQRTSSDLLRLNTSCFRTGQSTRNIYTGSKLSYQAVFAPRLMDLVG